jgi:drug/metabolite transporter (DMT)-like permease
MTTDARQRLRLMAAFAVVYIVWGSTYFAIRVGVQDLPPFLLGGARNTTAGLVLMLWAMGRGQASPWRSPDWSTALPVGLLMITLANGLTTLAEVWVPSNQAALISVSSALWTAWFGTFGLRGHALSARSRFGLALGFVGAVLLLVPGHGFSLEHLGAQSLILISTMCWAAGAMYGRARAPSTPPLMLAAMQMFTGGVVLLVIGFVTGEGPHWQWTSRGIGAVLYLAAFGSCMSYTTYIWLIRHVTPDKLSTIAYVNPLVAVILGWIGLGETLSWPQFAGMTVLLSGVLLINTRPGAVLKRFLKAG